MLLLRMSICVCGGAAFGIGGGAGGLGNGAETAGLGGESNCFFPACHAPPNILGPLADGPLMACLFRSSMDWKLAFSRPASLKAS